MKKKLAPLKDFPGYYIDMKTHEVWSYLRHTSKKSPEWYKLKIVEGKHPSVNILVNGNSKRVVIAKLVLGVQSGKSYYDIPTDTVLFQYNQDRTINIQSRSKERIEWWAKHKKESHDNRVEITEHHIYCLQLLLKAYKGDARPLLDYVVQKKTEYLRIVTSKGFRYEKAVVAFDATFDRMLDNIEKTTSRPWNFDGWFVKSMIGEIHQLYKRNSREVSPEMLPYFR